jgi:hypothetical protein
MHAAPLQDSHFLTMMIRTDLPGVIQRMGRELSPSGWYPTPLTDPTLPTLLDFSTTTCSDGGSVVTSTFPPRRSRAVFIHATRPLFAWSELEDSPSLQTIRAVLSALPDHALLDGLQRARGHGGNDYLARGGERRLEYEQRSDGV